MKEGFYSADKEYLEVYDTPIVQGKAMMAIFTDF
jgi:hypothetical protein